MGCRAARREEWSRAGWSRGLEQGRGDARDAPLGSGCVSAELKCLHGCIQWSPAAQRCPEGSCCTSGFPLPSSLRGFSTRENPKGCKLALPEPARSHSWQAQALKYCVNVNTEHLQQAELFASMALALVSLHHDQKVVENIYTNRLWAADLMKHLCTRQTLNCPKMGHMCFINRLLWRSEE